MAATQSTILVIDDEPLNLLILKETLAPYYTVQTASDGAEALAWLAAGRHAELVLSDVVMPNMNGYELCRRLKEDARTQDIPLLFLTSLDSSADEEQGLSLGAEDFIHKPISPPVVLARVRNHLELAQARVRLRERNAELELEINERTRELLDQKQQVIGAQGAIITAFCSLAETRDNETGNHILRTQHYVEALARKLRFHPRFAPELDEETIRMLFKSAPLHDVGKVGIPDAILLKPGPLNDAEWVIMRRHTEYGRDAILQAESTLGEAAGFLGYAREIAYCHHEKWDGSGYPQGLAGEAIPLSARLMAVADVYDALISRRVYKPAFPHERALAIIGEGKGRHFDPDIAAALQAIEQEFRAIAASYSDDSADTDPRL
jgi:putative two-component system response regulator